MLIYPNLVSMVSLWKLGYKISPYPNLGELSVEFTIILISLSAFQRNPTS